MAKVKVETGEKRIKGYDKAKKDQTVSAINAANAVPALRQQVAELAELVWALREEVARLRG